MSDLGEIGGDRRGRGNSPNPSPTPKKPQVPKRKNHFFTIFNYTEDTIGGLLEYFNKHATKYAFQEEICPETGNPHLQGMVMFPKEHRDTQFYKEGHGRFFPLKLTDGEYQTKERSKKEGGGRWTKGIREPIETITELYPWQKEIEDIYHTKPHPRKIYWYWEATGGVGKSEFVKYMFLKYNCIFCDGGKKSDLMNVVFNAWTKGNEIKCIMWDLPRAAGGTISYKTLEPFKNGLICNTKYEGGACAFNRPHIFIFANSPPDNTENISDDKLCVIEL